MTQCIHLTHHDKASSLEEFGEMLGFPSETKEERPAAQLRTYDVTRLAGNLKASDRVRAVDEHAAALTMARGILDHIGTASDGALNLYQDSHNDALISVRLVEL